MYTHMYICMYTPNLPTKIIPAKIARLETFREIPFGPESFTPDT